MSKTLKELFDEHGSVWLAFIDTPNKKEIKPLGYSEDKTRIIGEKSSGVSDWWFTNNTGFILYKPEPKLVKKVMWAPVTKGIRDDDVLISDFIYKTKDEAFKHNEYTVGTVEVTVEILESEG